MKKIEVVPYFNKELYNNVIDDLLINARDSIWIVTANLKNIFVKNPENPKRLVSIFEVFKYLLKKKIAIRIIHSSPPSRSFNDYIEKYAYLFKRGLDIRKCQRVHMKVVIADDRKAYVGSANFTGAGLGIKGIHKRNFELGFITEERSYIIELESLISSIWYGEECNECRIRDRCSVPISELRY